MRDALMRWGRQLPSSYCPPPLMIYSPCVPYVSLQHLWLIAASSSDC